MKKRILSLVLAFLVLAATLPMGIVMPEAKASESENFNVQSAGLPQNVVDKIIATFDEADAAIGENYNGSGYYPQNKAVVYCESGTTMTGTIANGALNLEWNAVTNGKYTTAHIYTDPQQNQNVTADTTMLVFHADTTGVVSRNPGTGIAVRFTLTQSKGTSGNDNKTYILDRKSYFFQPDGSDELIPRTTRSATSIYNCYLDLRAGESGTYYIPVNAFMTDENSQVTDLTFTEENWEAYITAQATSWRHNSSISLNFRDNLAVGDKIVLDDFSWEKQNPINYQLKTVTQDFTDFVPNFNWTWRYGNYSVYTNNPDNAVTQDEISIIDGRFSVTPNETAADGTRITLTIDEIGNWDPSYKAFAFDLDLSELDEMVYLRPKFSGRKMVDGTATASRFTIGNGTFYLLSDDGVLTSKVMKDVNYQTQYDLPVGFKGKVIIPTECLHYYEDTQYSLHDDFDELALELEITNWNAEDNGATYYLDNLTFYTDLDAPESGLTINSETNNDLYIPTAFEESINTVEAWVKTSSTTEGYIISQNYASPNRNYYDNRVELWVGMTSAGNPTYYYTDGTFKGYLDFTVSDVVINNGKWNHIAFVRDMDAGEVRFYLNGELTSTMDISALELEDIAVNKYITVGYKNDYKNVSQNYWNGEIANLRLWDDVRTSAEVFYGTTGELADKTDLLAEYKFADGTADTSGNGNDLGARKYYIGADDDRYNQFVGEITDAVENGGYSFVFLPDTQYMNYIHCEDGSGINYMDQLYSWIVSKKNDFNIQFVGSLGDMTDNTVEKTEETAERNKREWERVKAGFDKLSDAGIPWAPLAGNHDWESVGGGRDLTSFNTYFPLEDFKDLAYFGGSYYDDSVVDMYYYITVGDVEYLMLMLEFEPRAGVVEWAQQVIASNPDKKVVVMVHEYMTSDNILGQSIPTTPGSSLSAEGSYEHGASGETLWNEVFSQYSNVEMVLCGHISTNDINVRVDNGVNGNAVLQVICDLQYMEKLYEAMGCVAIATYNADGSEVSFKLYSTILDCFIDEKSNQLSYSTGSAISEKVDVSDSYADLTDSNIGLFGSENVIYDFTWLDTTTTKGSSNRILFTGQSVASQSCAIVAGTDAVWNNGRLKVTTPATMTSSNGSETKRADIRLNKMPNLVADDNFKAVAIHFDASEATKTTYIRFWYGSGEVSGESTTGATAYMISDDGTVSETTCGNWSTFSVSAGWSGYLVVPFEGFKADPSVFVRDDQYNSAAFVAQILECTPNTSFYIDNVMYLTDAKEQFEITVKDSFGNVIDTIYVDEDQVIDESAMPSAPERKGYKFVGWSADLSLPVMADMVVTALYEKDTDVSYDVTTGGETEVEVTLPENQEKAYYNDRVTLTAPVVNTEGQKFAYWSVNGSIFSYKDTISFLVFDELNVEAVYADEVSDVDPAVIYTNTNSNYVLNGTKWDMQVMGVVSAEDAEVAEIGILLSASEMTAAQMLEGYEANDGTVFKMASSATNGRQFLYTVKNIALDRTRCATVYAIIDGEMVVGDAVTCITIDVNGAIVE